MGEIDLRQFCGRDEARPYLMSPASRGAYTYATNGHILIRIDRRSDVEENPNFPDCEKVISTTEGRASAPLPAIELPPSPDKIDCWNCAGTGREHECPSCECSCRVCLGEGLVVPDEDTSITIGGVPFDIKYVRMFADLPNVRVSVGGESDPIRVDFDGGLCALMPLRHAKSTNINVPLPDPT